MHWGEVLTIIVANAGLFLWARAEARADIRMMIQMISEIKEEMKDFHGRLCAIEERYRGK